MLSSLNFSWRTNESAKSGLALLLGVCCGFLIAVSTTPEISSKKVGDVSSLDAETLAAMIKSSPEFDTSYTKELIKASVENEVHSLGLRVRVACLVLQASAEQRTHIEATWGTHCNKLLFFDQHTPKVDVWKGALKRVVYEQDWFLLVPGDTFVVVENVRRAVQALPPTNETLATMKLFGGAQSDQVGVVLSRAAVNKVLKRKNCTEGMASCFNHQIEFWGWKVDQVEEKNLPKVAGQDWWRKDYLFWPQKNYAMPAQTSITPTFFHPVTMQKMYMFEYLIYKVQVKGRKFRDDL